MVCVRSFHTFFQSFYQRKEVSLSPSHNYKEWDEKWDEIREMKYVINLERKLTIYHLPSTILSLFLSPYYPHWPEINFKSKMTWDMVDDEIDNEMRHGRIWDRISLKNKMKQLTTKISSFLISVSRSTMSFLSPISTFISSM